MNPTKELVVNPTNLLLFQLIMYSIYDFFKPMKTFVIFLNKLYKIFVHYNCNSIHILNLVKHSLFLKCVKAQMIGMGAMLP